ncbi:outer membrane beta-barrel protein [Thalassotalea aquiviva]|uniref:outer membrane beta-barrel protein n=1 Tax=Thalassotalea aquiviva TaxID=3242415 RepID=UPI00352B8B2D
MKKLLLASTLLLSVGAVEAAQSIRWDSATLSYISVDLSGNHLTGVGVEATKLVSKNIIVSANYGAVSDDITLLGSTVKVDLDTLSVGVGFRHPYSKNTDFFGIVSYEEMEFNASYQNNFDAESDNGYGLQAGVRTLINERIELSGSINYIDLDEESEVGFDLSTMYHVSERFSASFGYSKYDEVDAIFLSAILFF